MQILLHLNCIWTTFAIFSDAFHGQLTIPLVERDPSVQKINNKPLLKMV